MITMLLITLLYLIIPIAIVFLLYHLVLNTAPPPISLSEGGTWRDRPCAGCGAAARQEDRFCRHCGCTLWEKRSVVEAER